MHIYKRYRAQQSLQQLGLFCADSWMEMLIGIAMNQVSGITPNKKRNCRSLELPKNPKPKSQPPSLNTGPFQGWHCKKWNLPSLVGQFSLTQADDSTSHSFPSKLDQISVTFYLQTKEEVVLVIHLMGITRHTCLTEGGDKILAIAKPGKDVRNGEEEDSLLFVSQNWHPTTVSMCHLGFPNVSLALLRFSKLKLLLCDAACQCSMLCLPCMEFWVWKAAFSKP